MKHASWVMRATKPSPGRLFQYVSSPLFDHEYTARICMQPGTPTNTWNVFLVNDPCYNHNVSMDTKHHLI
jgi:hypothetical protein